MHDMFSYCSSLASLDVSNFDTSNVTDMRSMFCGCSSLTSLDVSNFDTSNVTSMSSMFSGCSSLASLDVSNLDTSNVTNMHYMFDNCFSFTSLDLSNFDTSSINEAGSQPFQTSTRLSAMTYKLGQGFILPEGNVLPTYQDPDTEQETSDYYCVETAQTYGNDAIPTGTAGTYIALGALSYIPAGGAHDWTGTEIEGVAPGEGYTLSGDARATDPGTYTATATLDENHVWSDGTTDPKTISWSIVKTEEAPATIESNDAGDEQTTESAPVQAGSYDKTGDVARKAWPIAAGTALVGAAAAAYGALQRRLARESRDEK